MMALLSAGLLLAGEPALQPVTVCEVLQDLSAYDGKVVAVVGRFSFRHNGRWLGEQNCDRKLVIGEQEWPNALWVTYDPASAPRSRPPCWRSMRAPRPETARREARHAAHQVPLRKPDYDSWAVVYGRVETRKDLVDGHRERNAEERLRIWRILARPLSLPRRCRGSLSHRRR
jgi:hypothetical protein